MTMLTREQILQADDIKTEVVQVPEWEGDVIVRALMGNARDKFEQGMIEQKGKKIKLDRVGARAKMCALSCVDEEGNLLFTEMDVIALGKKSSAALDRVYEVASRLSGLDEEDMDELVGNSESNQSDNSTSD